MSASALGTNPPPLTRMVIQPAAGHRLDEFRGLALDGVGDGELDRRSAGFQLHRAQRLAALKLLDLVERKGLKALA